MDVLYVCAFRVCFQRRPYRLLLVCSQQILAKTVSECTERCYTFKKIQFGCNRFPLMGGETKRLLQEVEEAEEKVLSYSPLATLGQERRPRSQHSQSSRFSAEVPVLTIPLKHFWAHWCSGELTGAGSG